MTPQQIEAMKMALEALKWCHGGEPCGTAEAITAIEEALAQPEQEPVAYTTGHCENHKQKGGCQLHNLQCGWPDCDRKPITTPPQHKPLTDEEADEFVRRFARYELIRAIEAAHGIKE